MKVRQGFVSNSSSSSFIISCGDEYHNLQTTADVALFMLENRGQESDKNNIEFLKKNKDSIDYPLCFKSCNYDTFIAKFGTYILISTCNNHQWLLDDLDIIGIPPCIKEIMGQNVHDEFSLDDVNTFGEIEFYHLDYDIKFVPTGTYCWCQECGKDLVKVSGRTVCPKHLTKYQFTNNMEFIK